MIRVKVRVRVGVRVRARVSLLVDEALVALLLEEISFGLFQVVSFVYLLWK